MTIIPEITISVREMAGFHDWTPVISPTTITTQAKPSPSHMPVKIDGSAAGQHHAEELR